MADFLDPAFARQLDRPAPSELVAQLPAALSFTEGATIPVNFLTAHYALRTVAPIGPGDKVLIHAAAGGTGMAAVQIALAVGAEIYATASLGKWETLRNMGVSHLYNSRTLDFADDILRDTDGQGVQIVLNSLTGEGFIQKSLAVLAAGGRFLEMAKRDVWHADEIKARRARGRGGGARWLLAPVPAIREASRPRA